MLQDRHWFIKTIFPERCNGLYSPILATCLLYFWIRKLLKWGDERGMEQGLVPPYHESGLKKWRF